jgi:hypothetical protein
MVTFEILATKDITMQLTPENIANAKKLLRALAETLSWDLSSNVLPEHAAREHGLQFTKAQVDAYEDWLTDQRYLDRNNGSESGAALTQRGIDEARKVRL